jgi:poly(A) polymerase
MDKTPKDFDIATNALAEQTEKLFRSTRPVGRQFGVMLVVIRRIPYEVATFRSDHGYTDGRHPDLVTFGSAERDAQRRDFTINGLFYDPVARKVTDYVGGKKDIAAKVIRAIGNPGSRFEEDKLRLLRAVRFSSTLGFRIHKATWKAIQEQAGSIDVVSRERIRDELIKIVTGPRASEGLKLLLDSGLLRVILPEVEELVRIEQPPEFHPTPNAFEHTRLLFDHLDNPGPRVAMAALLHDIGKARTMTRTDRIRFHNHDAVGAAMAEKILKRLRFSNDDAHFIVRYIRNHMKFIEVRKMRQSTLKRFLGQELFAEELELHRADCLASHKNIDNYDFCTEKLKALPLRELKPDPKVRGQDLIDAGYTPGPKFREILEFAYNEQLENKKETKTTLLKKVLKLFSK